MFYYAKLNQSGICIEIATSNRSLEQRDDLIRLQDYVPSVLNRKWLGDQWSQETYEDATEIERLREELANAQNSIAEYAERLRLLQLALDELLLGGTA